jgi:polysaccharide pyruvyl transferase WcaK-like protein
MYIQIDKTNFINKGAELMLHAIMQRISKEKALHPKFVFGRGHADKALQEQIRKNGMYQKFSFTRFRMPLEHYMEQKRLDHYGLVKEDSIDVLLDAGGFQFGDQWAKSYSENSNLKLIDYYKELKKKGVKIIFLPQAFGPFEDSLSRKLIEGVYEHADLLYARDDISYSYLINLFGKTSKINQAPDFTIGVKPDISLSLYNRVKGNICIIPNEKMLTHTTANISSNYLTFIITLAQHFLKQGDKLTLLNHEGVNDHKVIERIFQELKHYHNQIEVVTNINALEVKAVIGHSKMLFSSRFHGVISGLNQCVPTFCTSWSHKYVEVMKLYGMPNAILEVEKDINSSINQIEVNKVKTCDPRRIQEIEALTEKMWNEIIDFIS